MRTQIEALSHRANKGSQQLQGEVLEVQFESMLRGAFPHDEVTAIKTGAHGADILHRVRTTQGVECGCVLWEVKRTAAFSKQWIAKLKEDQRDNGADLAVILSQAMPEDVEHFGHRDGVWVTAYSCGLSLAAALRQSLLQVAAARRAAEGRREKTEILHRYLSGTEFRHRIEAMVDGYIGLRNDLEAEKRAMQRQWAKREKHLEQLVAGTAELYGGLQGIIGAAVLPDIPTLSFDPPSTLVLEGAE